MSNFAEYVSFMSGENNHQRIITEMNKYLNNGRFGSDFVDQVPLILANLYSVNIGILTRISNSNRFSVMWIRSNRMSSQFVCIIKRNNHYLAVSCKCDIFNQ